MLVTSVYLVLWMCSDVVAASISTVATSQMRQFSGGFSFPVMGSGGRVVFNGYVAENDFLELWKKI